MTMNARARGRRVAVTPEIAADIDRIAAIWTDCRHPLRRRRVRGCSARFPSPTPCSRPVALRFVPYGVSRPGAVDAYVATLMADPHLQAWIADAEQEPEVLEQFECGR
jgi:glutathione S-transferase